MQENFDRAVQERAVLVGLCADCFTKEQNATDETLEELEALLETAGGFCTGKVLQNRHGGLRGLDEHPYFLGFALTDKAVGIGGVAILQNFAGAKSACGFQQCFQFL